MFGNFWTVELQNLLVNTMDTVFKKQLPGGYLLFFIKAAKLKEKIMEVSKREHMMAILEKLKVDPNNIKSLRSHNNTAQSSFNRCVKSFMFIHKGIMEKPKFFSSIFVEI